MIKIIGTGIAIAIGVIGLSLAVGWVIRKWLDQSIDFDEIDDFENWNDENGWGDK